MSAPLFANLFHGHFRRKESERQASFFLRVTFTILFHAKSGGDIHTFDGFPCESLCLCDRCCGRGHSGQRFPSSVLLDRIARAASGQVAKQCPRTSAICEDLRARHSGFYDLFVPLWSRHRHRVALSSQVGAYFDLDLGRPVGFFRCHWDPHCVSDAVFSNSERPQFASREHASVPLDYPHHLRRAASDRHLVAYSLQPYDGQGAVCGPGRVCRSRPATKTRMPSPHLRARLVLRRFGLEPRLSSPASIPYSAIRIRVRSSRERG